MKKILVIVICIFMVTGCGCNRKEEKKESDLPFEANFNIETEVTKDGLKISDISLIKNEDGVSIYTATVINETDSIYKLNQLNIKIKNKKEKELTTLIAYIGTNLSPGESRNINISTETDLMNATKIEYEIK